MNGDYGVIIVYVIIRWRPIHNAQLTLNPDLLRNLSPFLKLVIVHAVNYSRSWCKDIPQTKSSFILMRDLKYENLEAQLMTVPPYAVAYVVTLLVSWSADHFNA